MGNKYTESIEFFEPQIYVVAKIGLQEHLRQFQEGKLRFRSLSYYRTTEGPMEPFRDPNEGVKAILQHELVQLTIVPNNRPPHTLSAAGGLRGQVLFTIHKQASVSCFYALHSGKWTGRAVPENEREDFVKDLHITEGMKQHGDHYLAITDFDKFSERLRAACEKENLALRGRLVSYVKPSEFHGHIPDEKIGFVKFDKFSYQREYRLMVESGEPLPDPYELDLGTLEDITFIAPLDDFKMEIQWGKPI